MLLHLLTLWMCVQILLVTSYYNMDLRWSDMLAKHIQHNVHLQ